MIISLIRKTFCGLRLQPSVVRQVDCGVGPKMSVPGRLKNRP
jgi:hypothetical protein